MPLAASNGKFTLDLGLAPGGVWKTGLGVKLDNRVVVGVLEAIGFTATPDGVRTDSSGTFTDLQKLQLALRAEIAREHQENPTEPPTDLTHSPQ